MARFRGTVQGSKGLASRLGGTGSGITVRANGWDLGVAVWGHADPTTGEDVFDVYVNGGSSGSRMGERIVTVRESGITIHNAEAIHTAAVQVVGHDPAAIVQGLMENYDGSLLECVCGQSAPDYVAKDGDSDWSCWFCRACKLLEDGKQG